MKVLIGLKGFFKLKQLNNGENNSNYHNAKFDALFDKMRVTEAQPERLSYIQEMVNILQEDLPWFAGFYPKSFGLYHSWVRVGKPSGIADNNLKYGRIKPELRAKQRKLWNLPATKRLFAVVEVKSTYP